MVENLDSMNSFLQNLYINTSIFYLQSNYLVFMAELFWWFEVVKPSFVQPRVVGHPQGDFF